MVKPAVALGVELPGGAGLDIESAKAIGLSEFLAAASASFIDKSTGQTHRKRYFLRILFSIDD